MLQAKSKDEIVEAIINTCNLQDHCDTVGVISLGKGPHRAEQHCPFRSLDVLFFLTPLLNCSACWETQPSVTESTPAKKEGSGSMSKQFLSLPGRMTHAMSQCSKTIILVLQKQGVIHRTLNSRVGRGSETCGRLTSPAKKWIVGVLGLAHMSWNSSAFAMVRRMPAAFISISSKAWFE